MSVSDMSLQAQLSALVGTLDECLGVAYVDTRAGRLMSGHAVTPAGERAMVRLAMAMAALGPGDGPASDADDVILASRERLCIALRGRRYPECVAVFLCRPSSNLDRALVKARLALPEIESVV
jgi:hypothetical protein